MTDKTIENRKTAEIVKKLRKDYNLSQEQVAEFLGISRNTYLAIEGWTRILKYQEKERLAELYNIEKSSFDLLENKESSNGDKKDKSRYKLKQAILYITGKCGHNPNLGKIVLNKLLYFADFNYYEKNWESITWRNYVKLPMWPVPQYMDKVLQEMNEEDVSIKQIEVPYYWYQQLKVVPLIEPDLDDFSASQIKEIDTVIEQYGDRSGKRLTDFSHEDMPWKATRGINTVIKYQLAHYRDPDSVYYTRSDLDEA